MADMKINKTTSSGMSPLMEAVLNRYVIENNKQERKYTQFAQKVSIPKGKTKTVAFDKISPLPKLDTELEEGVTPDGVQPNITRIKGEPRQFGSYISYTDQLDFFAHRPSPDVLNYTDLLKENQLETYETLDAMELASGTNVFYSGGATTQSGLSSALSVDDVKKAVTSLKRNKVQPANGTDFICFVHPDMVYHLWNDDDWKAPHTYADTKELYAGEVGRLYGVRFIEDPDAYIDTENGDIYHTIILGKNAFGTSGDETVELINKDLGSAGTADPLNQRGTYGWKGYWFTKVLAQERMAVIKSKNK